jgi:hypothetical protein
MRIQNERTFFTPQPEAMASPFSRVKAQAALQISRIGSRPLGASVERVQRPRTIIGRRIEERAATKLPPLKVTARRSPNAQTAGHPEMNYLSCRILVVAALASAALLVFVGDITAAGRAVYAPLSNVAVANQPEVRRASRH